MIIILCILLLVLMLLVGGDRGGKSFISLALNVVFIIISIYAISLGVNPILVSMIDVIVFCQISLIYQNEHSVKTYSAIISVIVVIVLLSFIIMFIGSSAKFGGYSELQITSELSMYLSPNVAISMTEVMIATTIISLLGAIMDTAMAITSSIFEFNNVNNSLSFNQLVHLGFNVGRDILGTMVNTIFFASIGETIMISILFIKFKYSMEAVINSKEFFQNVSRVIISNLGCLLIIPISIFVCSYMLKTDNEIIRKIIIFANKKNEE